MTTRAHRAGVSFKAMTMGERLLVAFGAAGSNERTNICDLETVRVIISPGPSVSGPLCRQKLYLVVFCS